MMILSRQTLAMQNRCPYDIKSVKGKTWCNGFLNPDAGGYRGLGSVWWTEGQLDRKAWEGRTDEW